MHWSKILPVGALVAVGHAIPTPSHRITKRDISSNNYDPKNNYGPENYYPNDYYPNQDASSSSSSSPYQDSSSSVPASSYQGDNSYQNGNAYQNENQNDSSNLPPTNTSSPSYIPRAVPTGLILTHCTSPGLVALTFDDGPYIYTNQLLSLLSSFSPPVLATFFVNGANWVSGIDDESTPYPSILRRIISEGHQLASHTWSHADLSTIGTAQRIEEVTRLEELLQRVVGVKPRYIRPPYASCENGCLEDLEGMGYHVVNFDLDTKDYENDSEGGIWTSVDKFNNELGFNVQTDSAIVLSHDVHRWTVETLVREMVKTIRERGFRTGTVGECLGDSGSGWYA